MSNLLQNLWRLTMDLVGYYDEELRRLVLIEETKKKPRGLNKRKTKQIPEDTEFDVRITTTQTGKVEVEIKCDEIPGWFILEGLSKEYTLNYLMLNTHIEKGVVKEKLIPITRGLSGFSLITKDDPHISEYLTRRTKEYASVISTKTKTRKEGHFYYNPDTDASEVFLGVVEDDTGTKYYVSVESTLASEKKISDVLKRDVSVNDNLDFNISPYRSVPAMVDFGEVVTNDIPSKEDLVHELLLNSTTTRVLKKYLSLSNLNSAFYNDSTLKAHIQKVLDSDYISYILSKGGKDSVASLVVGNNLGEFYNDFCELSSIHKKYLLDKFKLTPHYKTIYNSFELDDFLGDWDNFLNNYKKVRCWKFGQGVFNLDRKKCAQKIEDIFGKGSALGKVLIELGNHGIDSYGDGVDLFMIADKLRIINIKLEDILNWVNNKPSLDLMADIIKFKFVEIEAVLDEGLYFE